MERKNVEKYLIYNQDFKILVFKNMFPKKTYYREYGLFLYSIKSDKLYDICLEFDIANSIYLGKKNEYIGIFETENGKLKRTTLEKITEYYSCYIEFNKDFEIELLKKCNEQGFEPYMLSIEELKKIIRNQDKLEIKIDDGLIGPLEELQKRLNYTRY